MRSPAPRITIDDGVIDRVRMLLGARLLAAKDEVDEISITVDRASLVATMATLRDELAYQQLMEIAGVDYPSRAERFDIVYHLLSVTRNHRLRVRVTTDEQQPVPSVTGLWPVAGWLEREIFDLYGVLFEGNADLRRILTDYGFRGHPFRKDFPLTGYVEMRYSEEAKRVVYQPVSLAQDFRNFEFMSPWEGAQYVLPGDEKAQPEAKGAQSPAPADAQKGGSTGTQPANAPDSKVTESTAQTGAGQPTPGNQPSSKPADPDVVPTRGAGQNQ